MEIKKYTREFENLKNHFECGNIMIDNFLKNGDALDENQGITYVMLSDKKDFIIGYYNIEVGRVDQIEIVGNRRIYKPMGGTVNINYLAVHSRYQGTKIAETFEEDMNTFVQESDQKCYKLYKCVDDIIEI